MVKSINGYLPRANSDREKGPTFGSNTSEPSDSLYKRNCHRYKFYTFCDTLRSVLNV